MSNKSQKILLFSIAISLWIIVLQNFGVINPISTKEVFIVNTVDVEGYIDLNDPIEVTGVVSIDDVLDINLNQVAGYELVTSKNGMYIGVNSTENTIIPINWGTFNID